MQLSQGDVKKFYLYPINAALQLNTVRFLVESVDERARWYKALCKVAGGNKASVKAKMRAQNRSIASSVQVKHSSTPVVNADSSPRVQRDSIPDEEETLVIQGKPLNLSTLTDISQFLSESNNKIDL